MKAWMIEYTNSDNQRVPWSGPSTMGFAELFQSRSLAAAALQRTQPRHHDPQIVEVNWSKSAGRCTLCQTHLAMRTCPECGGSGSVGEFSEVSCPKCGGEVQRPVTCECGQEFMEDA
jgi:DnaJ-class molecular chaperone